MCCFENKKYIDNSEWYDNPCFGWEYKTEWLASNQTKTKKVSNTLKTINSNFSWINLKLSGIKSPRLVDGGLVLLVPFWTGPSYLFKNNWEITGR